MGRKEAVCVIAVGIASRREDAVFDGIGRRPVRDASKGAGCRKPVPVGIVLVGFDFGPVLLYRNETAYGVVRVDPCGLDSVDGDPSRIVSY